MSDALKLLNSLDLNDYIDPTPVDDVLLIDPTTRTIKVPSSELIFGVETDNGVERKHFRCPRIVGNNIDLTKLSLRVHFRNAKNEVDRYVVTDVAVTGDYVTFSWELSDRVLAAKGTVYFTVVAVRVNSDGTIHKEWNTTLASGNVLEGLEVPDLDYYEEEQARDVLTQLLSLLDQKTNEHIQTLEVETNQILADINAAGDRVRASIPEDYQATYQYAEEGARAKADAVINTLMGDVITASDCSDDYLRQLHIYGKSSQPITTGAQLFDASSIGVNLYTSVDANDIIRINCDNSTGTAAKYATFYTPVSNLLKPSTKYAIVLEVISINDPSAVTYLISKYSNELSQFDDSPSVTNLSVGTYVKFAMSSASFDACTYMCRGFMNIPAGIKLDAAIRISVIESDTLTADTFVYEPFTGGKIGPNPEYNLPIVSSGQRYVSGANLFKIDDKTFDLGNTTWTCKNGVVRIKGTSTDALSSGSEINQSFLGQSGTFTISGSTQYTSVYMNIVKDGVEHWYNKGTVTLDGTETKAQAYLQINKPNTEIDDVIYPMINRNSTTIPWEPYTATEKKVVDMEITTDLFGKNLIKNNMPTATNAGVTFTANEDGSVTLDGTPTGIGYYTFSFYDEIPVYDTDLTISLGNNNGKITLVVGYIKQNGDIVNEIASVVNGEVTFRYPRDAYKTRTFISVSDGLTFNNFTVYPMMRIAGENSMFDKYVDTQSIDISRTLPGIEVTKPELATYTDADGKMYYSDEIDFERGMYIQRVLPLSFTGDETISRENTTTWAEGCYVIYTATKNPNHIHGDILCNFLPPRSNADLADNKFEMGIGTHGEPNLMVRFGAEVNTLDLARAAWKSAIQNGGKVYVMLKTPIETPLTYEEIQAYRKTRTNRYNTVVVNNAGAGLGMTYNRDINLSIGRGQSEVTLLANKWVPQNNEAYYTQVVSVDGIVTNNTRVDLQPTVDQLIYILEDSLSMFAVNQNGVITVYSVGGKPSLDMTIKVSTQEVIYI